MSKSDCRYYVTCRICGEEFLSLGWRHIDKHGLTTVEYKEKFKVDYVYSQFLRKKISDGTRAVRPRKKRKGKGPYRPRTRSDIIRAIRAGTGKYGPMTYATAEKKLGGLARQASYAFGTWYDALEAAGVETSGFRHWTKKEIIRAIRDRRREKKSLMASVINEEDCGLGGAARRYFGTWEKAVRAAGIDYSKINPFKNRSRAALAKELQTWVKKHGPLNWADMNAKDVAMLSSVNRRYGSLEQAARSLRLPYQSLMPLWTKDKIKKVIRRRYREKQPLRSGAVKEDDSALFAAARRYFGSWTKSLAAACYRYDKIKQRDAHLA
ncbi:MucR family transcriptional regulator [Planctomycetota bacterium]